jgi:hypothetical protein
MIRLQAFHRVMADEESDERPNEEVVDQDVTGMIRLKPSTQKDLDDAVPCHSDHYLTLLITIVAAIRFPSWSYRLIGIIVLRASSGHDRVISSSRAASFRLVGSVDHVARHRQLVGSFEVGEVPNEFPN